MISWKKFKDEDMLDVRIIAYYNIPPSTSKKRRKIRSMGWICCKGHAPVVQVKVLLS